MYHHAFDWDDVRLFLTVAREGSLRGAARKLGISQPTVGRRLSRFESSTSTVPLFDRLPEGLRLTAAGKSALPLAEQLEATAFALQGRRVTIGREPSRVRISVGEWAGDFLAQCLSKTESHVRDGIAIELVASDQTVSLTHREADLAVRHGRPETGNLYVSRVGTIACAAYQARRIPTGPTNWISYTEEQSHYALARWIMAKVQATGGAVTTRASSMSMQVTAARAGAGVAVLPCYLADRDPALVRVQGPIAALGAPHWLIVHRDLRRMPAVRAIMDWITRSFVANRPMLSGAETIEAASSGVPGKRVPHG